MLHSMDEPFVSTQNFWSSLLVLFNEGQQMVSAKEKFQLVNQTFKQGLLPLQGAFANGSSVLFNFFKILLNKKNSLQQYMYCGGKTM